MLVQLKRTYSIFLKDENGLALTEYLILLGLLVGTVIISVLAIGGHLETAWDNWANWFVGRLAAPG
jgi:pilus assembly protein Flp/PilA